MFTVKQGSSDVPPATMASEAGPAVDRHPARQVGNPEPTVVGGSGQLAGRWPNLRDLPVHRCITDGLGVHWEDRRMSGRWSSPDINHINALEMRAIFLVVSHWASPPSPCGGTRRCWFDQTMSSQCNISTVKEGQFPPDCVTWQ